MQFARFAQFVLLYPGGSSHECKTKLHQIHLQEWTVRFADQKASDLTVRQWCEQNNLSFHTYNYWKHLLKEEVVDQSLPDIMIQLSDEQLNNLCKEALVIIVSFLQDQLLALQSQRDHANAQLSDNNRQIELLTEQIRIMNQQFFGRKAETAISDVDGQISLFESFNEAEYLNQEPSKKTDYVLPP